MTDPHATHLAFLLDRSGSMQSIRRETEAGFDAFVREQAAQPGRCTLTLAQFDTEYEIVHDGVDAAAVPPLALRPRGATALLDSIARLVHDTGARLAAVPEDERPGTVIVGIMTDGAENSSTEWTHAAVRALIEQQEREWSWTFHYLGANQDAIEVGAGLGVAPGRSLTYAGAHVQDAMAAYSANTSSYRQARADGLDVDAARAASEYTPDQRREAGSGRPA